MPSSKSLTKPSLMRPSSLNSSFTSDFSSSRSMGLGTTDMPRAPTSLLSGALPPSLLDGNHQDAADIISGHAPSRPRRLWTIQDASLPQIPKHYPPLDPNGTTFVGDASPSVIAVRIAECLRKRSIAVEYDDEAVTADCMTVDRCHFSIQLWRGRDTTDGVVVECMRRSGNPLSFHPACRAILRAALGQSTGDDQRPMHATNGLEFVRLVMQDAAPPTRSPNASAGRALEQARELLKKDRLDTQLLGMERLVYLTCGSVCGNEICLDISLQVLQEPWLLDYILMDEDEQGEVVPHATSLLSACTSSLLDGSARSSSMNTSGVGRTEDEARHESRMRAFALRVLCNALSNVAQAKLLGIILDSTNQRASALVQGPLLHTLVADLHGANRPPSVVESGFKLASVHEAALAVRCLRLLGEHAPTVQDYLQSEHVSERLELARTCGRSTHLVLQQEAERTYAKLTEDVRSC